MSQDTPIPLGLCQCGCGQATRVAPENDASKGWVRGEPLRFVRGHTHKVNGIQAANPSGLCMCGCGQPAPIARMTYASKGIVAGQPQMFVKGHEHRHIGPKWEVDPVTECWLWLLATDEKGYALTDRNGKTRRAHIVNYEEKYGPVPEGLELDHLCRVRRCVNPDHVEPVTHQENVIRAYRAAQANSA